MFRLSKKVVASVLGLGLLVGGFSAASGSASTEELAKADKVFVESIENDEVSPQFVPAAAAAAGLVGRAALAGGGLAAAGFAAGFGEAAGAWAWDQVTGIFNPQGEVDYQEINQVFDK